MPSRDPVPLTPGVLRDWPLPTPGGDKDSRGRTVVVGGSRESGGAVLLAATAVLRVGAGKLQVATAGTLLAAMTLGLPEALVRPLPENPDGMLGRGAAPAVEDLLRGAAAVLVGPGLTGVDEAADLAEAVVARSDGPVVVDALALAAVTRDAGCVRGRAAVLTPNRSELAHCLHRDQDEVQRDPVASAVELARRTEVVVCAGGGTSVVAAPDGRVWVDESGTDGLAVSGSGDVQAGAVAGLLARGAEPAQAAVWATHLHARAGERLAGQVGTRGFLARELPDLLPSLIAELAA